MLGERNTTLSRKRPRHSDADRKPGAEGMLWDGAP
jgi:hypothetical protein